LGVRKWPRSSALCGFIFAVDSEIELVAATEASGSYLRYSELGILTGPGGSGFATRGWGSRRVPKSPELPVNRAWGKFTSFCELSTQAGVNLTFCHELEGSASEVV